MLKFRQEIENERERNKSTYVRKQWTALTKNLWRCENCEKDWQAVYYNKINKVNYYNCPRCLRKI